MTDYGEVTAVIPHWNRAGLLPPLLKHLAAQTYPIVRTIVVDNGSTDGSAALAGSLGAETVRLPENLGFAAAVNRGIALARTDWIAILNNDITLEPAWLATLLEGAVRRRASFAVGKLLNPTTGRIDGTFDLVCSGGTAWRCGAGHPDGPRFNVDRTIHFAPLTAAIFRRDVFDRVGPLDERFGSYLEDVDLGFRCLAAGLEGAYIPLAVGTHQGSATRGVWHKATVRQLSRNQTFLVFKHLLGGSRWKILVAQLLWGLVALRHNTAGAWLAGKREGVRRRKELSGNAGSWSRIGNAVEQSERDLYDFQSHAGFDSYWRWYFRLTGGKG